MRARWREMALGGLAIVLGAALLVRVRSTPEPTMHPIALALMREQGEPNAWPPHAPAASAPPLTPSAAVDAIASSAEPGDAGLDAGLDAGPPLPEPPTDTPRLHVRRGQHGEIHYLEVVLGEASFDDAMPMVVVLHGRGARAEIPGGPFDGLTHAVRVIAPQASEPLGAGYEWLPVYVGQGLVDRLSSTLFAQAERVSALVRDLSRERPTIGRVIVSGFSQGGLLALTMALHHDDVVGEAFPLSSWLPPPLEPTYRRSDLAYPRIRSMHGTEDPTVPLAPTRELYQRLSDLGFDVTLRAFEGVGHAVTEDQNTVFHLWLEAAVCRALSDAACERVAEQQIRALLPEPPLVGALHPLVSVAAGVDAGGGQAPDAGSRPRRRAGRREPAATGPLDAEAAP